MEVIRSAYNSDQEKIAKTVSRLDIAKMRRRAADEKARAVVVEKEVSPVSDAPDWEIMAETESLLSGRKMADDGRYDFSKAKAGSQKMKVSANDLSPEALGVTDEAVKELVLETLKARRKEPEDRMYMVPYEPASVGDYARFVHEEGVRPRKRKEAVKEPPPKPMMMDATFIGQRFRTFLARKGGLQGKGHVSGPRKSRVLGHLGAASGVFGAVKSAAGNLEHKVSVG